jgi:hypothetical protein
MKKNEVFHYKKLVMKLFFLLGLLALILIHNSCYVTSSSGTKNQFDVQILSEPPGANIEINGKYVGDAPIIVKIEGFGDQTFNKSTEITALPIHPEQFVQRKNFYGGHPTRSLNDKIPERILFVMDQGRAQSGIRKHYFLFISKVIPKFDISRISFTNSPFPAFNEALTLTSYPENLSTSKIWNLSLHQTETEIDCGSLLHGVYILKIINDKSIEMRKIIIK